MSDVYNIQEIIGSGQNLISCSCNRRQYTHSTLTLSLAGLHSHVSLNTFNKVMLYVFLAISPHTLLMPCVA